jgi:hypothetical protein
MCTRTYSLGLACACCFFRRPTPRLFWPPFCSPLISYLPLPLIHPLWVYQELT